MDPRKKLQWLLSEAGETVADGSDSFVSLCDQGEPEEGRAQGGLGLSAPYLQWLDIAVAYEQESLGSKEVRTYVIELENYLWDHYERLETEESIPSGLLQEGLLQLIQLCERMRELIHRGGALGELGAWETAAYEANQLLLQGHQEAQRLREQERS
jgi:hypothetical protein